MRKCDRQIDLTEHETSGPILLTATEHSVIAKAVPSIDITPLPLTVTERDAVAEAVPSIDIRPVKDTENVYTLRPGSTVGALEIGGLSLHIRPKVTIQRLFYLALYAAGEVELQDKPFPFEKADPTLPDALARMLGDAASKAFARGLWQGYRVEEEALHTVRGRIMVAEQIRRRFDMPLPVEVRYDEWTEDILANRLIKAAARLLRGMRLNDPQAREGLRHIDATLANVTPMRYPPTAVPEVEFTRLHDHYKDAVAIARLVLCHWFHEADRGEMRVPGFLMDMNKVFQQFVTRKLREVMRASERELRSDDGRPSCTLTRKGRFGLKPDFSWWENGGCTFVGDAKYKRIDDRAVQNADIYQALAYATAFDLPGALLVYAKGEKDRESATHCVRHICKRIEVVAVDLTGDIGAIDKSIKCLAERVRRLRNEGRALREKQARNAQRQ